MKNEITHQIGDRVKVLHNIPLGNLIGTVTAIHYDTYEVTLDGGGKDNMYGFQLERITDTPETDAVREMWLMTPNVELGDGRPIHGNVVDVEFARRMERQRNEAREAYEAETLSTAELAAENLHLDKRWKTDNFYFCGMMQLLKEHGIAHGSKDLIAAGRRYEESESQREAAGTADEKPDGQAENTLLDHP
jgi:hypothetical protein